MKWFSVNRNALFFALTSLHPPTFVEVTDLSLLGGHHQLASQLRFIFAVIFYMIKGDCNGLRILNLDPLDTSKHLRNSLILSENITF